MAIKENNLSFLFLLSFFLLSATSSLASLTEDPNHWKCKQQCPYEKHYDVCVLSCEKQNRENQERESGRQGREVFESRNPQWEDSEEEKQKEGYPYFFDQQSLITDTYFPEGRLRYLGSLGRRSELLRGIENYDVAFIETNPNAFMIPHHPTSDCIFFAINGQGAIAMVLGGKTETHNIERGDILLIPAGTTCYLFNRDNNQKLRLIEFMRTISGADLPHIFYGAGGRNPQSFYKAFSPEILEAALNTKRENIEELFGQQDKGVILEASPEQIKALSQHSSSGGGGDSKDREPFNLLNKRPLQANDYGQLFEASPNDHKQLLDLNIGVSFANISQGSIFGPFYNSRATMICVVLKGKGYAEIACPHLARQQSRGDRRGSSQEQQSDIRYQRVSSNLSPGDMFIVPTGHPVVTENRNSHNENLQIVCFGVNFYNNERIPLAGEKNVISQLDEQAQELSFNQESEAVKQVFDNQPRSFFFPGPSQRQEGRASE